MLMKLEKKDRINLVKKVGMVLLFFTPFLIGQGYQMYQDRTFPLDFLLLEAIIGIYLSLNLYFGTKKMSEFCFQKRYWIGLLFLLYLVLGKYHSSSIYIYNDIIEPSFPILESAPIIGTPRFIRSDEFLVDTPAILNQTFQNYQIINSALMAQDKTVLMFPQLPTYNISVLSNPRLLGFFLLDVERAYSLYWFLPYFIAFFGILELFLILTEKKKLLSLAGTCLILFAPGMQWWNSPSFMAYGSWAIVLLNHFFEKEKKSKKLLISLLFGWVGSMYIMILYPAWQLTYGYLFLGLVIYILYKNKEKLRVKDLIYLIPVFVTLLAIVVPAILTSTTTIERMMSTVYPGARSASGGNGWPMYFYYISSLFYGRAKIGNPCEFSAYFSFFPIPLIMAIYYIIKNKKEKKYDIFLIIMVILIFLMGIWNFIELPLLSKITLLSMSTPERSIMTVEVIFTILTIYILSHYENKKTDKKRRWISIGLSMLLILFSIFVVNHSLAGYLTSNQTCFATLLFTLFFIFILENNYKTNRYFAFLSIGVSLYIVMSVHPLSKGLNVIFEKPIGKEIQKIVEKDKKAKWMSVDAPIHVQSYILANGARVINSTNYYPNFELWEKFDAEKAHEEVYNRYAHVMISITEEETSFHLLAPDSFQIRVNKNQVCSFEATYIVSEKNLEEYNNKNIQFEKIYGKDNLMIFQTNCGK